MFDSQYYHESLIGKTQGNIAISENTQHNTITGKLFKPAEVSFRQNLSVVGYDFKKTFRFMPGFINMLREHVVTLNTKRDRLMKITIFYLIDCKEDKMGFLTGEIFGETLREAREEDFTPSYLTEEERDGLSLLSFPVMHKREGDYLIPAQ